MTSSHIRRNCSLSKGVALRNGGMVTSLSMIWWKSGCRPALACSMADTRLEAAIDIHPALAAVEHIGEARPHFARHRHRNVDERGESGLHRRRSRAAPRRRWSAGSC